VNSKIKGKVAELVKKDSISVLSNQSVKSTNEVLINLHDTDKRPEGETGMHSNGHRLQTNPNDPSNEQNINLDVNTSLNHDSGHLQQQKGADTLNNNDTDGKDEHEHEHDFA